MLAVLFNAVYESWIILNREYFIIFSWILILAWSLCDDTSLVGVSARLRIIDNYSID